jgi:hypothetical protein
VGTPLDPVSAVEINHLKESFRRVESNVQGLHGKIDNLGASLETLTRIEERQASTNERLADGARTMNMLTARVAVLERDVPEDLPARLAAIETQMPGLTELRKFVVGGVVAGVGMILVALVALVLKGPPL